jgi:hypothetical protein
LGLVVVATVAGAALVFGGVLGGPSPTATPRTALVSASPGASAADVTEAPTVVTTDGPTSRPTPRPTRRATLAPTDEPVSDPTDTPTDGPIPTVGGPTLPPAGTFECEQTAAIQDPLSAGWRIQGVNWANAGATDRVTVTLDRFDPLAGEATQAIVHVLPVSQVADTLKVVAPSAGRNAVALGLWQGVRLTWALDRELSLPKVRWVTMGKDDNGFAWLVLGVRGEACYSLQVPSWSSEAPDGGPSIEVLLDVEH